MRQLTKDYNRIMNKTWGTFPDKVENVAQAGAILRRLRVMHRRAAQKIRATRTGRATLKVRWEYTRAPKGRLTMTFNPNVG